MKRALMRNQSLCFGQNRLTTLTQCWSIHILHTPLQINDLRIENSDFNGLWAMLHVVVLVSEFR